LLALPDELVDHDECVADADAARGDASGEIDRGDDERVGDARGDTLLAVDCTLTSSNDAGAIVAGGGR
jgi:hypothetical protein